jgi:metallo-beta-lactamase family protein
MAATLSFHGAAREVTGSCYHLELGDAALVIDCGTFQGDREADGKNREPFRFAPAAVTAMVMTHGHLDHVGRTPRLGLAGFTGDVIGHAATLEIAGIILDDSAKIANHAEGEPLYGADDVAAIRGRMRAIPGGYGAPLVVGPFTVTVFDAGHILGSSSVRVAWKDGGRDRAVLFSGDLGVAGAPILRDPNTTWDPDRDAVDYVVTESTYGDRNHAARADVRTTLRTVVERALADGGKVLIPAFSIGRTQEILYELNAMIEAGALRGIPVVVDGPLGLSATAIYRKHPEIWDEAAAGLLARGDAPLAFDHLIEARDAEASKRAVDLRGPAIIIAGSGMLQGGRIRHYLRRHLDDPKTDVLLVGYQAERTLGRALQSGAQHVFLGGQQVAVRARITTISGLSAHADRDGLAAWFGALPRRGQTRVFVTHGEPEAAESYAALLRDKYAVLADVPGRFQTVTLD